VDELPIPDYYPSFSFDSGPASPISSVTPPFFPPRPFSLPNADPFTFDLTTQTGGFPLQGVVHQEQSSVYATFPGIWDKDSLVLDQVATLRDPAYQYPFSFESTSLDNYLAEDMLSFTSNKMVTPLPVLSPVSTFPLHTIEKG
jgi:hypothetical protein